MTPKHLKQSFAVYQLTVGSVQGLVDIVVVTSTRGIHSHSVSYGSNAWKVMEMVISVLCMFVLFLQQPSS